jgi:uncharacterized protein YndB with AHSA1/START domain
VPVPQELLTLRHTLELAAPPAVVYERLMDSEGHSALTGLDAVIDWREGGRFFTCAGRSHGYTLHLAPDRRIVQAWAHADFAPHQFTVVTFDLEPGATGTRLQFTQVGVWPEAEAWLRAGWQEHYWAPLLRLAKEAA